MGPPSVKWLGWKLMTENMAHLPPEARRNAVDLLADLFLRPHAAAIVPRLTALAKTSDELSRIHILGALAILDSDNREWTDQLTKLSVSSDKVLAKAAEDAVVNAQGPPMDKTDR